MPRVILLTSTFLRHQFVINYVAEHINLVGVWQEKKTFRPEKYAGIAEDQAVIERHFIARDASEEEYFGSHATLKLKPETVHCRVAGGSINDEEEVKKMRGLDPDVVLVYGTGILKEGIIGAFTGNIINIHLGLSPYYRGSGTNFWPLVNWEPEYVGATIHYIDAGIDTGPIIAHVRPKIEPGDGPHDIGNKTIIAAADALVRAAEAHVRGEILVVPQEGKGKLYQRKDFNADAVRTLYRNFEVGMIEEYLQSAEERDARLDLISLPAD